MTERLAFVEVDGGRPTGPMVEYVADVARPVGMASDGVWLTGHPRMPAATNTRIPEPELPEAEGRTWRVIVVGALLVGGLWGVAVAWTLLAQLSPMLPGINGSEPKPEQLAMETDYA